MSVVPPVERRLRAQIAAHEAWAREPGRPAATRAASLMEAQRCRLRLHIEQGRRVAQEATATAAAAELELAEMDVPA